jgi:hypothetical protein
MARYMSRAKRAGKVCDALTDGAGRLKELVEELRAGDITKEDKESAYSEGFDLVEKVKESCTDIEDLKDELEQWRDGMSGTNLESSNKYSMLEEAVSVLEGINVDFDTSCGDGDEAEDIASDFDDLAGQMEDAAGELEGVEFPGMYD